MSDLAAQITSLMALGPFAAVAAATGFTFSMTALGASFVYFIRDTHNQFMQSLTLGFAAGVMMALHSSKIESSPSASESAKSSAER